MIAQGHHRAKNAPASSGFYYEPCHIIQMARAVHKLPDPLDRLMLALEVGKFLGALRTSDLNFAGYHSWAHIKSERVLVRMCATTKSTNKTAGQLLQGCPFRIPLVPCLEATNWHVGIKECLLEIGVPPAAEYLVPMSPVAYKHGLDAGGADASTSIRHLRKALAKLGWPAAVIRAITEHTSKRSVGRVVQRYFGAMAKPSPEEVTAFLHHRETGPHKSARAYNPDDLVAPVGIIEPILELWLSSHIEQEAPPPPQMARFQWGVLQENAGSKRWNRKVHHHILAVHSSLPPDKCYRLSKNVNRPGCQSAVGTYQPICNYLDVGRGTTISIAAQCPLDSKLCGGCLSNARIFNVNLSDLSVTSE